MPTLASIHLYPIKSTAGMPLERVRVTQEGLAGDRRYMVVKPDGTFITARTHPQLQQVATRRGGCNCAIRVCPLALMEAAFSRALSTPVSGIALPPCTPGPKPMSG
jgi:hypothetical protein